ncbi:hypothetical protein D3C71_2031580 [compost metagenome]
MLGTNASVEQGLYFFYEPASHHGIDSFLNTVIKDLPIRCQPDDTQVVRGNLRLGGQLFGQGASGNMGYFQRPDYPAGVVGMQPVSTVRIGQAQPLM